MAVPKYDEMYKIMPNHIYMIVIITYYGRTQFSPILMRNI